MSLTGNKTYVGFGFGAIQAGLFLYEAFQSGAFGRLVVAEVVPDVIEEVRRANHRVVVNIAHQNRVEHARVGPVEIENPALATERGRLVNAIAKADEIGSAIPGVAYYALKGAGSLHRVLAEGLRQKAANGGPQAVVYAAENHNHAAEILEAHVFDEIPADERDAVRRRVRFLNTVIGKMSGIVTNPAEIRRLKLSATTPNGQRVFLVEAFNRILVSKVAVDFGSDATNFKRGLDIFKEKENLLPFEEAKLYGHNATHALAAYLGALLGVQYIADLQDVPGALSLLRAAFIEESGQSLIKKYAGFDVLFTEAGYRRYVDDLLTRMTNPCLRDTVERVGRDPERKLGWNDRLVGTIRLALSQGVNTPRYGLGAAAALAAVEPAVFEQNLRPAPILLPLWQQASPDATEVEAVLTLITNALQTLKGWRNTGHLSLETLSSLVRSTGAKYSG